MSASAIVMMLLAIIVLWGGLGLAVVSLVHHGAVEDRADPPRRDL